MSMKQTYAVFGLGRYGRAVAKELVENGVEVLAVDIDENLVNDAIGEIPYCKCADITDEEVVRQLGIANVDVVIIAMATNLEASVMATIIAKEAGVPLVVAKARDAVHARILRKVGADRVIIPEKESGIRMARSLMNGNFIDFIELSRISFQIVNIFNCLIIF